MTEYDNFNTRLRTRFNRWGQSRVFKCLAMLAALAYLGIFVYNIVNDARLGHTGAGATDSRR